MKRLGAFSVAVALSLSLFAGIQAARPQGRPLEVYVARLSARDHFNSNGERLGTVAGIIRQDRANYHRFGLRDPEDTDDAFFASADNRARLERLLLHGTMSSTTRDAIINGEPVVVVEVYDDYVNVFVK